VSGQVRGRAPIDLDVDSEVSLEVLMTLDGYWPQTVYLSASDPDEVEVTLRPRL